MAADGRGRDSGEEADGAPAWFSSPVRAERGSRTGGARMRERGDRARCGCVSGGCVGGREGEIERRGSGLGLTGHRLGYGWALEAGPRRLDGLVVASEQKGQPSRYFPRTEK